MTPKEPVPKTAEKNIKEGKNEDIFVNLHPSENMKHESALMRKIEHGAEILSKNNKYITPVTFEFALIMKKNQINLFESHKKVFTTMKMMDNTTPIIIKKVFEHPDLFPEGQEYFDHFPSHNEVQRQRKVFVRCQVESSIKNFTIQSERSRNKNKQQSNKCINIIGSIHKDSCPKRSPSEDSD